MRCVAKKLSNQNFDVIDTETDVVSSCKSLQFVLLTSVTTLSKLFQQSCGRKKMFHITNKRPF